LLTGDDSKTNNASLEISLRTEEEAHLRLLEENKNEVQEVIKTFISETTPDQLQNEKVLKEELAKRISALFNGRFIVNADQVYINNLYYNGN